MTRATVKAFHDKYYVASNITIAVVGDVDPEDEFLLNILYNLGQEGITRQIRLQGAVMNDFPYVRKEAIE